MAPCSQNVTFHFEEKPSSGFSPLVLSEPARRTAIVNAGDYRLYLGGGAINRALADLLKEQQDLRFGKICQPYADLHLALLAASRDAGGECVDASALPEVQVLLSRLHLSTAFAQAGLALEGDSFGYEAATGAVFLDIFTPEKQPVAEGNVAMLYVVGPKGEGCTGPKSKDSGPLICKPRFLAAVEALGKRALDVVEAYNQSHTENAIKEVRWCLVSGGVYCHKDVTKVEVAAATLNGMRRSSANIFVTFTYDDDVFRRAHDEETKHEAPQLASSFDVETAQLQSNLVSSSQEEDWRSSSWETRSFDDRKKSAMHFVAGEQVEALYSNGYWYRATIESTMEGGQYIIDWEDHALVERQKSTEDLRRVALVGVAPVGLEEQVAKPLFEDPLMKSPTTEARSEGQQQQAYCEDTSVTLSVMIDYLEAEVSHKELSARVEALAREGYSSESKFRLLTGNGLSGQEALDAYVSDIVAALRDFPYLQLLGGRDAGTWVRDEVVAPMFRGRWDFYSNKKRLGFDLKALEQTICGKNMLWDRLRHVRQTALL